LLTANDQMLFEIYYLGELDRYVGHVSDLLREAFSSKCVVEEIRGGEEVDQCYNRFRGQYHAEALAAYVSRIKRYGGSIAVALFDLDAYVPQLNFVFGLALPGLRVATVYTPRLRYMADDKLFIERLRKEVLHEVGHVLGLEHCSNRRCVMSFSNSILEVDAKEARFCVRCTDKLARRGVRLGPGYSL